MSNFEGKTIEQALQSKPVLKTSDLVEIFDCKTKQCMRTQCLAHSLNAVAWAINTMQASF